MRILLVTQYFHPENFKSSELAFELAKRGHHVDALVGIPNYPEGKYYNGYGVFKKRREVLNGVNVYRAFQTPRGKGGAIGLSLNFLSFAFFATLRVLFHFAWKKKYDAIVVYEPSPITQMIPAIILGGIRGVKVYSWVTDIWPDSVVSTIGEKKGKYIKGILNSITNWVYRHSDKILISSKGMESLVNRDADYSDKIIYYPHWCEDMMNMPREKVGDIPTGFNIMLAGSVNDGIGIPALISLAKELEDAKKVNILIVGGGSGESFLKEEIAKNKLTNIYMFGRHPFSKMPAFYDKADAMLLTLKESKLPHLRATVPSRLQSYMSAGKPILAMIDGSASDLIQEANCGFAVHSGEAKALACYIKDVILKNKDEFAKCGNRSREYYLHNFTKDLCVSNLEKIMFD